MFSRGQMTQKRQTGVIFISKGKTRRGSRYDLPWRVDPETAEGPPYAIMENKISYNAM